MSLMEESPRSFRVEQLEQLSIKLAIDKRFKVGFCKD